MSTKKKFLQAAAGNAGGDLLAIEDVFSTYLYTGNGSTQTITNGIDLAGEGGLVWIKNRTSAYDHYLSDTEHSASYGAPTRLVPRLETNNTDGRIVNSAMLNDSSYNNDGFTLASYTQVNEAAEDYASWTFRKAPRFFDVVTYTGDGTTTRDISHGLGVVPGCIIIKRTNSTSDWPVYHRGNEFAPSEGLALNLISSTTSTYRSLNSVPTDTTFTVGAGVNPVNVSGATYVAYLFAHDPLGPSGDGSDGMIACGSYTGNGTSQKVDLGWEPQWILVKSSDTSSTVWGIVDSMRGVVNGGNDAFLEAQSSAGEGYADRIQFESDGFTAVGAASATNNNGSNYIYIAIRRGPMRQPTSGTEVFAVNTWGSAGDGEQPIFRSGFTVDNALFRSKGGSFWYNTNRLMEGNYLVPNETNAQAAGAFAEGFDYMNGWRYDADTSAYPNYYSWMFRRAPGFFDVVAYQGDNVAGRTVPHNLGVAPEMMIVKSRQITNGWFVYHKDLGATYAMNFDNSAAFVNTASWNSTAPTDSVFTLGGTGGGTNAATSTFIAYLFATLPGISKVGSYTGTGSDLTIDCGFSSGARFVLIKCSSSTGNWFVFDAERGITVSDSPRLTLDTSDAESSGNLIDPSSSGFIARSSFGLVNTLNQDYIFYAIA